MKTQHKLYCYVDETGQDTKGRFYIVAIIITTQPQELVTDLEKIERTSGKGKVKWHRAHRSKIKYVKAVFSLKGRVHAYYQVFRGSEISFELATVQAIANAINAFCYQNSVEEYKAIVVIDGLPRSLQHRTGKFLRGLGIRTKSVRGERDETSPLIRLADAIVGLLREAHSGSEFFNEIEKEYKKQGIAHKLY